MKKIPFIIIILTGLAFASCNDFLDRPPLSDIGTESFWKTEADLQKWNAGMYSSLRTTLGRHDWANWGEIRSGIFYGRGTAADANLLWNSLTSSSAGTSWGNLYSTIYRANAAITHIPNMDLAANTSASFLAQAYVMRALMYFYAIRVWGDVPLIEEPLEDVTNQTNYYPRTSIHTIKTFMLADIDRALTLWGPATTAIATASKWYLNRGAAVALKADIHMWFKEYDEAIAAIDALPGHGYSLVDNANYKGMFLSPVGSPEPIFNLYWDFTESNNGMGMGDYYAPGSSTMRYQPNPVLFTELVTEPRKSEDLRVTLVLDTLWIAYRYSDFMNDPIYGTISPALYQLALEGTYGNSADFQIKCPKFSEYSAAANENNQGYIYPVNAQNDSQMPIYRYADMLLLKAEALTMKSSPDLIGALQIVNDIRTRAGWVSELFDLTGSYTQHDVLRIIIDERMYEFYSEGKHWFDLVRNDLVKEYLDPIFISRGDLDGFDIGLSPSDLPGPGHIGGYGRILWPINSGAFLRNPLLINQQNPPYTM